MKHVAAAVLLSLSLSAATAVGAKERAAAWPDTYESRVEILALVQTLDAQLLASPSATRTLEEWCGAHRLAPEAKIVATRITTDPKLPSSDQLERLGVRDASEVRYRRVELRCGARVLSVADNWYVPARLTPAMNAALEATDAPFGRVVQPLRPYRRTIAATMLWTPLPRGWEQQPRTNFASHPRRALAIPRELFVIRAVLYDAQHQPFSEVVETYQSELLAFARR